MPISDPPPIQHPIATTSGITPQVWVQWFIKVATEIDGGTP